MAGSHIGIILGLKPQAAVATLWRALAIKFIEPTCLAATKALRGRAESYYPFGISLYGTGQGRQPYKLNFLRNAWVARREISTSSPPLRVSLSV